MALRELIPLTDPVALRKESVDRNYSFGISGVDTVPSLSARRAWIEIEDWLNAGCLPRSLSARRAWIEITCTALKKYPVMSLSARRAWIEISL